MLDKAVGVLRVAAAEPCRAGRAVRAHRAAARHRAPARGGAGGARSPAPRLRRQVAAGARVGRAGRGRGRPAAGGGRRRAAPAARHHRRERAALPARRRPAGVRGGGRARQRPARHRAGRLAAADDRGLRAPRCSPRGPSPPCSARCWPTPGSTSARSSTCAAAGGRRAWPSASPGWPACRRRCATRAGNVVAAVSVSGPIERIGRRPGVRWAADLLAAAEALHHRPSPPEARVP